MGRRTSVAHSKMVVKTDLCNYSGFRIYPGHGKKFVRSDQKMFTFITAKSERCFKKKRRKAKKTVVRQREISGISAEMLEKKRAARPVQKDKARDAALKELKSRKGAKKGPVKK